MIEAVLFDFGGTLDSDGVPWPQRFFAYYKEAGICVAWEPFLKAFYRSDDGLARRHRLQGLDLEGTVALQAAAVAAELAPDRPELGAAVAARFAADSRAHFARQRPMLERLGERFRLGIVSNFYGNLEGLLRAEGWAGLFGVVADSGVLGATKPEPAIFRHALDRLGVLPERAFMVGDSLERDIRGAERLGLSHALLRAGPEGAPPCCPAGRTVRTLAEMESLLPALRPGAAA
ncbi:MAG: HAD family hydrolase [Elusimicrobia bacterium]|nr:HAD family hydrolase [Elusimicrobiota bacterium]